MCGSFIITHQTRRVTMKKTSNSKLRTGGALIAVISLLVGCAAEDSGPEKTSLTQTVDVTLGQQPNSDVVSLAEGDSEADITAAIKSAVQQIPELAESILTESGVPGMAVAVVHGGEMIYAEGFGIKKVGENELINPETVFQIASISKSISATAVAKAITDGLIEWETPVISKLPNFQLADGFVTANATVSDYFTHRTGLKTGAGDDLEDLGYDRNPDPQSPAGGVSSNVIDLAKWMNVLLAQGNLQGQEYIDQSVLTAATTGQVVSGHPSSAELRTNMYGYGFNVGVQPGGRTTVGHSGAFVQGAGTNFQLVPSLDFGIVTLTNGGPIGVPEALNAQVIDLVQFGKISRDWVADYRNAFGQLYSPVGDLVGEEPPAEAAAPENLEEYTGTFVSDYFGTLKISIEGDALVAGLGPEGGYTVELLPWNADTFSFEPTGENAPDGSLSSATFERTANSVTGVTLEFFNTQGLGKWKKTA